MSGMQPEVPAVPASIEAVLARYQRAHPEVDWESLRIALIQREDEVGEYLRFAGMRFGLFPQIVAEVLMEVGLGTPMSEGQRDMIHHQFHALLEQIERAQRGEGPMPTP